MMLYTRGQKLILKSHKIVRYEIYTEGCGKLMIDYHAKCGAFGVDQIDPNQSRHFNPIPKPYKGSSKTPVCWTCWDIKNGRMW